jgi:hypothetical protein
MLGDEDAANVVGRDENCAAPQRASQLQKARQVLLPRPGVHPGQLLPQVARTRHGGPAVLLDPVHGNVQASERSHDSQGAVMEDVRIELKHHDGRRTLMRTCQDAPRLGRSRLWERTAGGTLTSSPPSSRNAAWTSSTWARTKSRSRDWPVSRR